MPLKLLAFDWDGTLADNTQDVYEAIKSIFNNYEVEPPSKPDCMANLSSQGWLSFYYDRGLPGHVTKKDVEPLWQKYFSSKEPVNLRGGVLEVFSLCQQNNVKICIVSGSFKEVISNCLSKRGLRGFVDHIEGSASGKIDELRKVAHLFSVRPEEMTYVDDSYEGISAAKTVGASAFAILGGMTSKERLLEANPDYLIDHLHQLLPFIPLCE